MSRLCMWDFTLKYIEDIELSVLKDNLRGSSKRWVFQLEISDKGYKHYQGRISLIKKKDLSSLVSFFKTNYPDFSGVHFSPTSKEVAITNNFNYVLKDDTRVEGPWADTDEERILTKQMELYLKWGNLPWQSKLQEMASQFNLRTIDLIYDQDGNNGKSLFSEHMEYIGLSEEVPPYRLMDDIFQWVCTRPIKKNYIFDLPRGMKKDKLADFYSGIEVIKNGVAYDKRHRATKIRFDRPRVFVFSNTLPEFGLMSKDRWKVWTIYQKDLKEYTIDDGLWNYENGEK